MAPESDLVFIRSIIQRRLDPRRHRAFVFGSRATAESARFSDYDIGIEGQRLPSEKYFDLLGDFEDSDFPYLVQIVQFCDVSDEFIRIAKQAVIPLDY